MKQKIEINRRQFFKNTSLSIMGGPLLLSHTKRLEKEDVTSEPPKIKEYRTLGRTGFKVSDIAAGEHHANKAMLEVMLDAGINYIDTAESYGNGRDEIAIGEVIRKRNRKSIFISSKLSLRKKYTKDSLIARTRKCLERLQTGYIDCLMIHACPNVKTVKSIAFHEAMNQLKSEGRIRYVGISNHGSNWDSDPEESMEKVLLAAAEDGRFDVMLLAYNFMAREMGKKVLKICNEKKIGTTLMKTDPVSLYLEIKNSVEETKKEGKEVSNYYKNLLSRLEKKSVAGVDFMKKFNLINPKEIQDAAIRFALNNPHVNTICKTYNNFDDVESYIKLSGSNYSKLSEKKIAVYSQAYGNLYCRHACGLCEPHCPNNVPVNTIMRYNHYFTQSREKHAMLKYANLPTNKADICFSCKGYCETACPYGVPIHGLLLQAHRRLILA